MINSFGMFRKRLFFILLILMFLPLEIFAQEDTALRSPEDGIPPPGNSQTTPPPQTPELTQEEAAQAEALKVTDMDIRTSTLSELADWCRTLGLSEGGTREDLSRRLRSHYGIAAAETPIPLADGEEGARRTIIIESARSTEYFTLQVVGEEYARLEGNVVISLKDGDDIHRIKAWEIVYNRTRNTMTAKGSVEYQKESGDTVETFKGDSLTINMETWGGVFTGGASERSVADSADNEKTAYRFEGSVISRSGADVTVLQDAVVSNAKNEENYWSIHASKIWLLPGSDWAIFNAVLKVGEIPLLYIPFFFLPADEIVFHPVIGTRPREGSFFQTTTYILGRPEAAERAEFSITNALGSGSDTEKTRNGLFLRSTGRKARDPNDTRLSVLFDAYANLGVYVGTEFELPKTGVLNSLNLSFGIGFTRDIYQEASGFYTPFAPNFDGSSNWNKSKLFSLDVPFRYRLNTSGEISGVVGNLSWNLPLYSDPFVERDFMNRSEDMDLVRLMEGNTEQEETNEKDILSSYEIWLKGSSSPRVTALNPYISRLSISNLSSILTLRTRNIPNSSASSSPDRVFFYPDKFTLISLSASISGTPFASGNASKEHTNQNGAGGQTDAADDPLRAFGVPRPPWEEIPDDENTQATPSLDDLVPPVLKQTFTIPSPANWPSLTIGYSLNPSGAVEMQYNASAANWPEAKDVRWDDVSSILSLAHLNGKIDVTARDALNYYTITLILSGESAWRDFSYINKDAPDFDTEAEIIKEREDNYKASFVTGSSEFSAAIRPFPQHAVWGNSNIRYTLRNLLAKTEFSGTGENPDWKIVTPSWDKDGITAHKITTYIAASVWEKNQTFSFDADLPPRDGAISTTANLRFWYSETYINGKIRNPFDDKPIFDPYTFRETLRFNTDTSLQYSMVYNPQEDQVTSISAGLVFKGFTASFAAKYMTPYFFDDNPSNTGWKLSTDKMELVPEKFSLAYDGHFNWDKLWNNRMSLSINVGTGINFDLQRYTYSSLDFDLDITLKIKDILDISFRSQSANSVIYRYFQDIPGFSLPVTIPGEKNFFLDLINSFRFDNEALRKSSGFKLRQLSLNLTHYMGDWNMTLKINLAPYLDRSKMPFNYKFNTEISFMITWVPISAIKSEINYDRDKFTFR